MERGFSATGYESLLKSDLADLKLEVSHVRTTATVIIWQTFSLNRERDELSVFPGRGDNDWREWIWRNYRVPPQTMQTKRECNLSLITCNINRIFQSIYILVTVHVSSEVKLAEKWSALSNWFDLLVLTTTRFLVYVRLADCLSHLSGEAAPQTPAESESWKSKVKRNVQIIPLGTFTISEKK